MTRLHCRACGTTLEGDFNVGRFARLGREQFALLETFLRARGNLKDLERELGVSYPTVRARVDALLRALGLADGASTEVDGAAAPGGPADEATVPLVHAAEAVRAAGDSAAARRVILEKLARHEIDPVSAAAELRGLGG